MTATVTSVADYLASVPQGTAYYLAASPLEAEFRAASLEERQSMRGDPAWLAAWQAEKAHAETADREARRQRSALAEAAGQAIPVPRAESAPRAFPDWRQNPRYAPAAAERTAEGYDAQGRHVAPQAEDEARVAAELRRLRVQAEARRRLRAEGTATKAEGRPGVLNLSEWLSEPDEPMAYAIDGLLVRGGSAVLSAQYKAGKTTLVGNLIRAYADRDPFLGLFEVPEGGDVVLIDFELSRSTLRRWLRDQGLAHPERVRVIPARGRAGHFDLTDPEVRAEWAALIGPAALLVVDTLRAVLDALGLDENHEASRWLVGFEALKAEAGIRDGLVVHHMGHSGERARGDSGIPAWADANWKLIRADPDDEASARYFSAYGRDVEVVESALSYEPDSRRLTLAGGSRKDAKTDGDVNLALSWLQQSLGPTAVAMSQSAIVARLDGSEGTAAWMGKSAAEKALKAIRERALWPVAEGGRGKPNMFKPADLPTVLDLPTTVLQDTQTTVLPPYRGGDGRKGGPAPGGLPVSRTVAGTGPDAATIDLRRSASGGRS